MKEIKIPMENGNSVIFKSVPQYGFWTINFAKGGMPAHLQGMYTSYEAARDAVNYYLQHRAAKNRTKLEEKGA